MESKILVQVHNSTNSLISFLRNISAIISSVGGVLSGLSLSWLLEDKYKKTDQREDAQDLFAKALDLYDKSLSIYDRTINQDDKYPLEYDLKRFRKAPVHFLPVI